MAKVALFTRQTPVVREDELGLVVYTTPMTKQATHREQHKSEAALFDRPQMYK